MYTPNPIDTSRIQLSDDITVLSEKLAKNTHEVWSAGRIAEGWVYGKNRDDTLKHHPCLVLDGEVVFQLNAINLSFLFSSEA